MSLKSKEKPRFLAFPHTVKFPVSPSNLKNLTASPGVGRVRTPSGYFFGTFFVQAKKVHIYTSENINKIISAKYNKNHPRRKTWLKYIITEP